MTKMTVHAVFASLLLLSVPFPASAQTPVAFSKKHLHERLLLQVSYKHQAGPQDFMNTRSRIVEFEQEGMSLRMVETARDASPPHVLATIPIRGETPCALLVDFNAGFDKIFKEEDRTGEDYDGRVDRHDYSFFALRERTM